MAGYRSTALGAVFAALFHSLKDMLARSWMSSR
jgi:hypothetical protein